MTIISLFEDGKFRGTFEVDETKRGNLHIKTATKEVYVFKNLTNGTPVTSNFNVWRKWRKVGKIIMGDIYVDATHYDT